MPNIFQKEGRSLVSMVSVGESGLQAAVRKSVDLIGGIDKLGLKGKSVLIKPNFNTDDTFPASTDPAFLRAVTELVQKQKPERVIIGESCTYYMDTRKVMNNLGIFELAEKTGAELMVFEEQEWIKVNIPNGRYLKSVTVPKIVREADRLIFLPCLKTHFLGRFTMSIKLSIGFMKKSERMQLHSFNFEQKVAELASIFDPDLILLDGRKCFVTKGPMDGKIENPDIIMASGDRVTVDVEAVKVLQGYKAKNKLNMNVWELPQIKRAVEMGMGAKSEKDYLVVNG